MRRVQARDTRAFAELYDRHIATALRVALAVCGSREGAEEAVQDGFLAVWRGGPLYDETRGSAKTWILTAIRNRSIDIFRRDRRDKTQRTYEFDLDLVLAPGSVEGDAARAEDFRRLRATLQELPPLQRQALALAYFGGLTHVQIAERLKLPVGTVKTRVRLALHKIRTSDLFADGPRPRENARPVSLHLRRPISNPRRDSRPG